MRADRAKIIEDPPGDRVPRLLLTVLRCEECTLLRVAEITDLHEDRRHLRPAQHPERRLPQPSARTQPGDHPQPILDPLGELRAVLVRLGAREIVEDELDVASAERLLRLRLEAGSDLVAKAAPDGYTMLTVIAGYAANVTLYQGKLPFDGLGWTKLGLLEMTRKRK